MLRKNISRFSKFVPKNLEPKFRPNSKIPLNIQNEIHKYKVLNKIETIPSVINGKYYYQGEFKETPSPFDNNYFSAKFHYTSRNLIKDASYRYKSAKKHWNQMELDKTQFTVFCLAVFGTTSRSQSESFLM